MADELIELGDPGTTAQPQLKGPYLGYQERAAGRDPEPGIGAYLGERIQAALGYLARFAGAPVTILRGGVGWARDNAVTCLTECPALAPLAAQALVAAEMAQQHGYAPQGWGPVGLGHLTATLREILVETHPRQVAREALLMEARVRIIDGAPAGLRAAMA